MEQISAAPNFPVVIDLRITTMPPEFHRLCAPGPHVRSEVVELTPGIVLWEAKWCVHSCLHINLMTVPSVRAMDSQTLNCENCCQHDSQPKNLPGMSLLLTHRMAWLRRINSFWSAFSPRWDLSCMDTISVSSAEVSQPHLSKHNSTRILMRRKQT